MSFWISSIAIWAYCLGLLLLVGRTSARHLDTKNKFIFGWPFYSLKFVLWRLIRNKPYIVPDSFLITIYGKPGTRIYKGAMILRHAEGWVRILREDVEIGETGVAIVEVEKCDGS